MILTRLICISKKKQFCFSPWATFVLAVAGLFVPVLNTHGNPAYAGLEQLLPLIFHAQKSLDPAIQKSMEDALETLGPTIPALLQSGNFQQADDLLRKLQADAEVSIQAERELVKALWVITDINEAGLGSLYEEWIRRYPNSFAGYLAYGVYHSSLAWNARGSGSGDKLKQTQIKEMLNEFQAAYAALENALELNPKLIVVYAYQIDAYKSVCRLDKIESIKSAALALQPNSWWVRAIYLHAMTPRWCGSLEKMQAFLDETDSSISTNPNLAYLRGRVIFERAEEMSVMASHPNYAGALPLYSEALKYGDYFSYRLGRANALMKLRRYPEAIADLEAGIRDRPTYYELHLKLAEARSKL